MKTSSKPEKSDDEQSSNSSQFIQVATFVDKHDCVNCRRSDCPGSFSIGEKTLSFTKRSESVNLNLRPLS